MSELEQKKLFVGGLTPDTTEDDLRSYFGQFGAIEHCQIKMDKMTDRSKGYGFITYEEDPAVDKVLDAGDHKINGKVADAKRATKQKSWDPPKPKKVFVGGVPNDVSEDDLKKQFEQFGEVQEVVFPVVIATQKRRGFAFVEFVKEDSVDKACRSSSPIYVGNDNKQVEVKPATPRGDGQRGGGRGGRGGRGGFGGGRGGGRGGWGGQSYGGRDGGYGGGYGGGGGGGYGGGGYGGNSGGYGGGGYQQSSGGYGGGGYGSGNGYDQSSGGYGGSSGGYSSGYGGGGSSYGSGGDSYGSSGSYGGGGQSSYGSGGGDYGGGGYGKTPRGGRGRRGGYQPY